MMHDTAVILLAAGRGTRMRGAVEDKILAPLGGRRVIDHVFAAFTAAGLTERWVVVYRDEEQRARLTARVAAASMPAARVQWVRGGRERQDSVARALVALEKRPEVEHVLIHDCARPLVRAETLRALHELARRDGAACLAHRVTDTIKQTPATTRTGRRLRLRTIDRTHLWAMETPQAFALPLIAGAYRRVRQRGARVTDDAAAIELTTRHGLSLLENPDPNPKITQPADLAYAAFLLAQAGRAK